MSEVCVVLVSAPDAGVAATLGRTLVEEKLAACVNVLPELRSIYTWQGKLADETEALMLIKTRRDALEQLRARVLELHPYECVEFLALPVTHGNVPYLDWIRESVKS